MSKSARSKKGKVPKITEEEYTAYVTYLREMTEAPTLEEVIQKPSSETEGLKKE